MELPKNITQIGETNHGCKIYVEDYVFSYIKQLNQVACNKELAVALYGTRRTENNVTYIFVYGACKLDFLQRETRHLSQAQHHEVERLRNKYFDEYEFQGYRLLNGEMVEGFHICEQDICRYVSGYAQFYEKNDGMLAYMLEARPAEAAPEVVNQEKYDMVKKRQEERRGGYREKNEAESAEVSGEEKNSERREYRRERAAQRTAPAIKKIRFSTAAVFGLLCLAGLAFAWDEQQAEDLQAAARQVMTEFSEQKLPDNEELLKEEMSTLITEDKLSDAVLAENSHGGYQAASEIASEASLGEAQESASEQGSEPEPQSDTGTIEEHTAQPNTGTTTESAVQTDAGMTAEPEPQSDTGTTAEHTMQPDTGITAQKDSVSAEAKAAAASYIVQKGDTLIGICIRQYGTDEMVSEVCGINGISDSDDIKVGQKILLP